LRNVATVLFIDALHVNQTEIKSYIFKNKICRQDAENTHTHLVESDKIQMFIKCTTVKTSISKNEF